MCLLLDKAGSLDNSMKDSGMMFSIYHSIRLIIIVNQFYYAILKSAEDVGKPNKDIRPTV